jgi:hypothetical protein
MASVSSSAASSDVIRRALLALVSITAACGRVAFDTATIDAASDAAPDAYSCVPGPWTSELAARPTWLTTWHQPSGNGVSVVFSGGALRITQTTNADEWGGVLSPIEPFAERSIAAELTQVTSEGEAIISLDAGDAPWLRATVVAGARIYMANFDPPDVDDHLDVPYDPVEHRFVRLREHAGTVYFEASPDGMRYTTLYTSVRRPFLDNVRVVLGAGASSAIGTASEAVFETLQDCSP